MTGNALIHALVIGASVGILGRFVLPGRDAAPVWLAIAVGLGAALLGTISARVAGIDVAAPSVLRLAVQAGFAGAAVTLAVATARHTPGPTRRSIRRWRAAGDPAAPADQEGNRP
ncbi:hypothetical protein [Salinispora fenicalii]|uniref:hypothetical protein n=1 Tax=Salinispora fenicalii TaxID=1137263 RepID=UPI00035D1228|nr:hypothetical protein [Salinispora fenicalii]